MRIVVYTAAIGQTDAVRAPTTVDANADYLCFTDQPSVAEPYERIEVPPSDAAMLAARRIKVLAEHPRLASAAVTLWHDASYMLRRNLDWLRKAIAEADLVAMKHPRRNWIEDEAAVIAKYGYLTPEAAQAHVARYRSAGFQGPGVTASGLLGRRVSDTVAAFNAQWWAELQQWGGRDQGSLDFAAWANGIRVAHVPGTVWKNRMARWREKPTAVSA